MLNFKKISKPATVFLMLFAFMCSANTFAQRVIKISTTDQMRFTVDHITAKPGEKITIELVSSSHLPAVAMAHNFVLLKQGVDAKAFVMAGVRHKDNEYIDPAKASSVIAKTALASGSQTVKVTFTVPQKTGSYEYVCTFPGHYISGMKGTLIVK